MAILNCLLKLKWKARTGGGTALELWRHGTVDVFGFDGGDFFMRISPHKEFLVIAEGAPVEKPKEAHAHADAQVAGARCAFAPETDRKSNRARTNGFYSDVLEFRSTA
jgi:hypothetical protein